MEPRLTGCIIDSYEAYETTKPVSVITANTFEEIWEIADNMQKIGKWKHPIINKVTRKRLMSGDCT